MYDLRSARNYQTAMAGMGMTVRVLSRVAIHRVMTGKQGFNLLSM